MPVSLHPKVLSDVRAITAYYREVVGPSLASEFYRELRRLILRVAKHPGSFAAREHGLRRANLLRFPYHLLFRTVDKTVRILVVRHDRQRPAYGVRRR